MFSVVIVATIASAQSESRTHGSFPMERADGNNDGEVSWREVHKFAPRYSRKQFNNLDRNGDGLLTKADVRKRPDGANASFPEGERLKAILRRADANDDDRVTKQELEATAPQLATRGFTRLDANKDGAITEADLKKVNNISKPDQKTVREADVNGDGLWSYAELKTVATRLNEEAFNSADSDDDGLLNSEELAALRRAAKQRTERSTQQAQVRRDTIEKVLESDTDDDGEVSFEELIAAKPGFPRKAFDRNDRNKDGVVTRADLP